MNLVIVESPAKAKTINKYLGDNYTVLASYGHIRDLPSKNGSVDPEQNFKMEWEVDSFSKKYLKEITDAAKGSSKIILATDPDREGEAIAWHVKEYLNEKKLLKDKEVERVVFNEITKKAVTHGIENPRQIEQLLVDAYMARRALDYLVGFNISPILWTKLPGSKSAGRVQSVALKLITEREHEIESFDPEEFWTLSINFQDNKKRTIVSSISQLNGKKIEKFSFRNKNEIDNAIVEIKDKKFNITDISSKVVSRNPSGPFTTSTLQQVASSRLGFGASRTMQIAQRLYQGIEIDGETIGLITYMRTDGTNLSVDAISDFRDFVKNNYGNDYLPEKPLNYSGKKAKNAQEAHEAIRPTDISRTPDTLKKYLSSDQQKLYNLIWGRALSSQMETAKFDRNTRIDELRGSMLLVLEPSFISILTNCYYGGKLANFPTTKAEFTATEDRIIEIVSDGMGQCLQAAWKDLMPITIKHQTREINPQFATLVEASDSVIICSFVVQLPNVDSASFDIIYPLQTLKPIASLLRSRVQSDVVDDDTSWKERLEKSVLNVPLPISAILGEPSVPLSNLLKYKPGDVVKLPPVDGIDFFVDDKLLFKADIGETNGQVAVSLKNKV